MIILNEIMVYLIETIPEEARSLIRKGQRGTLRHSDLRTAIQLMMPPELCRFADQEGENAVNKHKNSYKWYAVQQFVKISVFVSFFFQGESVETMNIIKKKQDG